MYIESGEMDDAAVAARGALKIGRARTKAMRSRALNSLGDVNGFSGRTAIAGTLSRGVEIARRMADRREQAGIAEHRL